MKENPQFDQELEDAITFLVEQMKSSGHNPKPVILHSVRVAMHLLDLGYSREIILAAVLHDLLEDSETSSQLIQERFGAEIARLVEANTFDNSIPDKTARYKDAYARAIDAGYAALIVRTADILDNSPYIHFVTEPELQQWLLGKTRYFLDVTRDLLQEEKIWQELQEEFTKISLDLSYIREIHIDGH